MSYHLNDFFVFMSYLGPMGPSISQVVEATLEAERHVAQKEQREVDDRPGPRSCPSCLRFTS